MKAFDLRSIVNNFYRDIYEDKKRPNREAYFILVFPAVLSQISIVRPIDADFISAMSTALAVLFGFTFTSLLTTAKYSPKGDKIEEKVVRQARIGTSYALLINLISLFSVVFTSIAVVEYSTLPYLLATTMSAFVYYFLFHYLTVMMYMMRYLYLLTTGGALEKSTESESTKQNEEPEEITVK
jgi:hypothetical protein